MLIRSFIQVFPHVSLWLDGGLLIGSNEPLDRTLPWVDRVFEQPIAKAALSQVNIRGGEDVRKLFRSDRAALEAYVGDGPVITDDRPRLEYFLDLRSDGGPRRNINRGLTSHP
jgi:spermidine synthase